ncbi:hypothetical protein BDW75DRAFT_241220 [Aspergillus navahoensis]
MKKEEANRDALHHPAVVTGRRTYTHRLRRFLQPGQRGDADAKVDFTHIDDLAGFLVATIDSPDVAENKSLNIVSDRISYNELAAPSKKYSKKKVEKVVYPIDTMRRAWKDPEDIPQEVKGKSAFPDDFWMLVKSMQGLGWFWRRSGEVHNDLFPELTVTTSERYFQSQFAS